MTKKTPEDVDEFVELSVYPKKWWWNQLRVETYVVDYKNGESKEVPVKHLCLKQGERVIKEMKVGRLRGRRIQLHTKPTKVYQDGHTLFVQM